MNHPKYIIVKMDRNTEPLKPEKINVYSDSQKTPSTNSRVKIARSAEMII